MKLFFLLLSILILEKLHDRRRKSFISRKSNILQWNMFLLSNIPPWGLKYMERNTWLHHKNMKMKLITKIKLICSKLGFFPLEKTHQNILKTSYQYGTYLLAAMKTWHFSSFFICFLLVLWKKCWYNFHARAWNYHHRVV